MSAHKNGKPINWETPYYYRKVSAAAEAAEVAEEIKSDLGRVALVAFAVYTVFALAMVFAVPGGKVYGPMALAASPAATIIFTVLYAVFSFVLFRYGPEQVRIDRDCIVKGKRRIDWQSVNYYRIKNTDLVQNTRVIEVVYKHNGEDKVQKLAFDPKKINESAIEVFFELTLPGKRRW